MHKKINRKKLMLMSLFFILTAVFLFIPDADAALDNPHNVYKTVNCADCHKTNAVAEWWTDQGGGSGVCYSCHNSALAVLAKTHSSTIVASTKYGTWEKICTECHDPHYQKQNRTFKSLSYLYSGVSTAVTTTTLTKTGAGWTPDQWAGKVILPNVGYASMNHRILSNTADTITIDPGNGDTINLGYIKPGSTFSVVYGKLVKEYVDSSATRFFRQTGTNSFADGDATMDGICEVCHTKTNHHRKDGTGPGGSHLPGARCTMCHPHAQGFKKLASSATDCVGCHSSGMGSRRQIVDDKGDGTGTGGDFKKTSHHVYPASGTVQNTDCQVCHDQSQHTLGTVRLKNLDTGEVYNYNPVSPVSAELHCLSCHDSAGATSKSSPFSPFSDGKILGAGFYKAGIEIKDSWNKTYGHKQKGLTCIGNGDPNTGCHSGGHGSDNVGLLSKKMTLPYPVLSAPYEVSDEGNYELCFGCHSNYLGKTKEDILGVKQGGNYDWDHYWGINPPYYIPAIATKFRDRYSDWWGGSYNLHYFHLEDENWWYYWGSGEQGGWKYRDSIISATNCLQCHSVHGSNTQQGWMHDEMQYTHYTDADGEHGLMQNLNATFSHPINCNTSSCHLNGGPTNSWIEPSGE